MNTRICAHVRIYYHIIYSYSFENIFDQIAVHVSCGDNVMAPSCFMCPKSNDTISHSWCSGYCTYDTDNDICTERSKYSKS